MKFLVGLFCIALMSNCNHVSYTPHSKTRRLIERPSPIICDRIVDFRLEVGSWPISKQDFMNRGLKYYEALIDFPYQTTTFKIKDSTEMTFYYSDHIDDLKKELKTKKTDLNKFNGNIHFWKEGGRFLWKINMK